MSYAKKIDQTDWNLLLPILHRLPLHLTQSKRYCEFLFETDHCHVTFFLAFLKTIWLALQNQIPFLKFSLEFCQQKTGQNRNFWSFVWSIVLRLAEKCPIVVSGPRGVKMKGV